MLIDIPCGTKYEIKYLVFDYNGTIAQDGILESCFLNRISKFKNLEVFVITADTYGTVEKQMMKSDIKVSIISKENGMKDKLEFVSSLGANHVIAFGNGNNDRLMLEKAGIGICIIGSEGASIKALTASDLVVNSLEEALNYIDNPQKLIAGLRE